MTEYILIGIALILLFLFIFIKYNCRNNVKEDIRENRRKVDEIIEKEDITSELYYSKNYRMKSQKKVIHIFPGRFNAMYLKYQYNSINSCLNAIRLKEKIIATNITAMCNMNMVSLGYDILIHLLNGETYEITSLDNGRMFMVSGEAFYTEDNLDIDLEKMLLSNIFGPAVRNPEMLSLHIDEPEPSSKNDKIKIFTIIKNFIKELINERNECVYGKNTNE